MIYIETREDRFECPIDCTITFSNDGYWMLVHNSTGKPRVMIPKHLIESVEYEYDED